MSKIVRQATVFIQVDLEKDLNDEYIAGEICRRISMHSDVHDANWIRFGNDNPVSDNVMQPPIPGGFLQRFWNRVNPAR